VDDPPDDPDIPLDDPPDDPPDDPDNPLDDPDDPWMTRTSLRMSRTTRKSI